MGRKKIKIEKIQDDKIRQTTFRKRKDGLFKKAIELSLLCEAPVYVIVGSPTQHGLGFYQYRSTLLPNEVKSIQLPNDKTTTYVEHDLQRKFANHSKYMKIQKGPVYPNYDKFPTNSSYPYSPCSQSSSPNPFGDSQFNDLSLNGKRSAPDSPIFDGLNTYEQHFGDYSHNSKMFYNQQQTTIQNQSTIPQLQNSYDFINNQQQQTTNNSYTQSCNSTPPSPSPPLPGTHSLTLVSTPMIPTIIINNPMLPQPPIAEENNWNQNNFQLNPDIYNIQY